MPVRAKTIFFDLGETLVTQNIEDSMVTRSALEEIGPLLPDPVSTDSLFKLYQTGYKINDAIRSEYNVEIPIQVWMRQLLRKITDRKPADQFVDRCVKIIVKKRAANAVAFDDARSTLKLLHRTGRPLAIISNVSSHDVALEILRKVRLLHFFDQVITSAQVGLRKPDPGIFRFALSKFDLSPEEAIIVGDSEWHDVRGGYAAGLRTVLVNRRKPLEHSMANYRFRSLAESARTLQSL